MPVVELTRQVTFASGHRYWRSDLTPAENEALFGPIASPYNHGHNYTLEATFAGEISPADGMVINIKTLDDMIRRQVTDEFNGKSINDEVAHFASASPSLENLLHYISRKLDPPAEARLTSLLLREMPDLWGAWRADQPTMISLTRSYEFAASHRLHIAALSDAENQELFGKCNNRNGHGHNYILEVTVTGEPDATTGWICDLLALDEVVNARVVDRYDHKSLNEDIPEFAGLNPTSEVVAQVIFDRLRGQTPAKLAEVRLWETARSAFTVRDS
ncbi:MAG: 6-carboxytetrahydropterin synthase [Chthonomonas sp.]|nr:6-carboxytetrahydropterin synthase [Chthonomonas sp.]